MSDAVLSRRVRAGRAKSARSIAKGRIASALCLVPAAYLLCIVAFALRNGDHYASAAPQLVRYIVAPALLAFALILVAVRGSRMLRVNIGGAVCALLLLLFACEAWLESRYYAAVMALRPSTAGQAFGPSEREGLPPGRTIRTLNRELGTSRLEDAVLAGVPASRVRLCDEAGRAVTYRADRYGFRNPDAAWDRRPDLLVVGDSFVEGICLPDGRDLMGRLRGLRPTTLGMGMRGAGPLHELAMLGRYGPLLKPRRVVIAFYEGNDWKDLENGLETPWLVQVLSPDARFGPPGDGARDARAQAGIARWSGVAPPTRAELFRKAHVTRNFFALHQVSTQLGLGYPKATRPIPAYERVLARARAIAAGWGGEVTLMYIPETSRFVGLLPHQFVYDGLRGQVTAAARRQGVPVVDLTPAFRADPDPLGLYAQGHFSERGARFAAAALVDHLHGTEGAAR